MLRSLAGVALVALAAAPVSAQQRLFALVSNQATTTSLWEAGIGNGSVTNPRFVALAGGYPQQPPIVAGGGRFIVWGSGTAGSPAGALVAVDRLSGAIVTLPEVGAVVSDPTATRLFVGSGAGIAAITTGGTTVLANTAGLSPVAVARDGAILYATSSVTGPPAQLQLHSLDTATGSPLGSSMPLGPDVRQVFPADDGHSVWIVKDTTAGTSVVTSLHQLAAPSGSEMLAIPLATMPFQSFFARIEGIDAGAGRIFVSSSVNSLGSSGPAALMTFDTATGTEIGRVALEGPNTSFFDETTARLLTVSATSSSRPVARCGPAMLHLTDALTGQQLSATSLGTDACLSVAFAAPPAAPVFAPAAVTPARTVSCRGHAVRRQSPTSQSRPALRRVSRTSRCYRLAWTRR